MEWGRVVSGVGEGGEWSGGGWGGEGCLILLTLLPCSGCVQLVPVRRGGVGGHSGPSLQRHGPPEDLSVGHPPLGALEGAWQTHPLTLVCDSQLQFSIHSVVIFNSYFSCNIIEHARNYFCTTCEFKCYFVEVFKMVSTRWRGNESIYDYTQL